MSMAVGGKSGLSSDINMTPMIDVLLVLIIIFMVITPLVPKGLDTLVPQPNPNADKTPPSTNRTIVIQVLAGGAIKINQEDVSDVTLGPRLEEIFKTRAERVAFVKADDNIEFKEVAKVIDIAKGTNVVDKIGLMTAKMEAGQ
jgi:biopolymer transport protein TolR